MPVVTIPVFAWMPPEHWIIPAMGMVGCGLVYLVGRLFFSPRPEPAADPNQPIDPAFLEGVARDRRVSPRRKGNAVEVVLCMGNEQEDIQGWVTDRSIGGLGVLVDGPLPKGAVLKIRPKAAGESTPWTEVTVRSCRRDGLQYEIGFQFHRTPNWSLLLQFG